MNVGFYSHHITENNFSQVTSKILIAIFERILIMADLSTISDTDDFSSVWNSILLVSMTLHSTD